MELNSIEIKNFKGIKSFNCDIYGNDTVITAANGVGKTTLYDAFLWLLFGKDSTGRKDFELRPLDNNNQPITGLTLSVQADINIVGSVITLRKEHHEKIVKKQIRGYETLCWIDEAPKKVSEYAEYIAEIIPEDTFKLLADLKHFNTNLHWKERRSVLLDIAGEIESPAGYDELIADLKSRTIDEYKQVLTEQKKRYEKERSEINPRIDELQRGLENYATFESDEQLESAREKVQNEISQLDAQRNEFLSKEKERQDAIDKLNQLKSQKIERETVLKNDSSNVQKYLDEKTKIETGIAKLETDIGMIKTTIMLTDTTLKDKQAELQKYQNTLKIIRDEFSALKEAPTDNTCKLCGQALPTDKLEEIERKRELELQVITQKGNDAKNEVKKCNTKITEFQNKAKEHEERLSQAEIKLREAKEYAEQRIPQLDEIINDRPKPVFSRDEIWNQIELDIKTSEKEIGQPVNDILSALEETRKQKSAELEIVNKVLAQSDRMKKDQARIKELEMKEKEIAQALADIEKQLNDIQEYKSSESQLIEAAVNGMFKHVKFKLFNILLNESIEECCEATHNGIPYADMSYGQKIIVGIDIINVLSVHYKYNVPLFIDNAESLTYDIDTKSQTIELRANKDVNSLTVETKQDKKYGKRK